MQPEGYDKIKDDEATEKSRLTPDEKLITEFNVFMGEHAGELKAVRAGAKGVMGIALSNFNDKQPCLVCSVRDIVTLFHSALELGYFIGKRVNDTGKEEQGGKQ